MKEDQIENSKASYCMINSKPILPKNILNLQEVFDNNEYFKLNMIRKDRFSKKYECSNCDFKQRDLVKHHIQYDCFTSYLFYRYKTKTIS